MREDFLYRIMKINEFGKDNSKKIMLIPGTMMCWKQFEPIIPLLENVCHLIVVSTDGFDGDTGTTFTTAEDSAQKLAEYIKEKLDGNIQLVFGESFGSASAAALFARNDVKVERLIMNGPQYMNLGILNKVIIEKIPKNQYKFLSRKEEVQKNGKIPFMMKLFTRTDDKAMLAMLKKIPDNISYETLNNCMKEALRMYSDLEKNAPNPLAKVSIWYGEKEPNMKKAVSTIKKVYPNAEDHPFEGIGHGEILSYPEKMATEILKFLEE